MTEDVLVPTESTWDLWKDWFTQNEAGYKVEESTVLVDGTVVISGINL